MKAKGLAKNVKVSRYRWWWLVEWQEDLPGNGLGDFALLFRREDVANSFAGALKKGDEGSADYWANRRLDRR